MSLWRFAQWQVHVSAIFMPSFKKIQRGWGGLLTRRIVLNIVYSNQHHIFVSFLHYDRKHMSLWRFVQWQVHVSAIFMPSFKKIQRRWGGLLTTRIVLNTVYSNQHHIFVIFLHHDRKHMSLWRFEQWQVQVSAIFMPSFKKIQRGWGGLLTRRIILNTVYSKQHHIFVIFLHHDRKHMSLWRFSQWQVHV